MVSFTKFIEEMTVPNLSKSKGKRRYAMPQIDKEDIDDFIEWGYREDKFGEPEETSIHPVELIPTQSEFNEDKVKGMIESGNYRNKRVMIANDNKILDGHHTWLAHVGEDEETVDVLIFPNNVEEMIKYMKDYPKSYTKKLNEEIIYYERN